MKKTTAPTTPDKQAPVATPPSETVAPPAVTAPAAAPNFSLQHSAFSLSPAAPAAATSSLSPAHAPQALPTRSPRQSLCPPQLRRLPRDSRAPFLCKSIQSHGRRRGWQVLSKVRSTYTPCLDADLKGIFFGRFEIHFPDFSFSLLFASVITTVQTMSNAVDRVLLQVLQHTGYPVSVTPKTDLQTHASMVTATPKTPVHAVFINPARAQGCSNYLVAMQAAMILVKWSDPRRVPDFMLDGKAIQSVVKQFLNDERVLRLPNSVAMPYVQSICQGLALQLTSAPVQILAADWCYKNCPELEEEQRTHVRQELRDASACLTKDIRMQTPEFIFTRNATMNAAYAAWWSALAEDTQVLLPYEFFGFKDKGMELYGKATGGFPDNPNRYCEVVDSWAVELEMRDWYKWQFRQG